METAEMAETVEVNEWAVVKLLLHPKRFESTAYKTNRKSN